ncbi:di-heme oxidoredictase family protein [Spirosoma sp. SC4-14]|uniref:di-heme oxidoreductase family protein n=1 Tax=Spirosoma sp. SC4-14 TaxID=3128900 RepID=UPI0030D3E60D
MKPILTVTSILFFLTIAGWSCQRDVDALSDIREAGEELSGGAATTSDLSENAFGNQADGVTSDQENQFVIGNSFFRNNWTIAPASASARDGLGPMMNAVSCSTCHLRDGRGEPPADLSDGDLKGLLFRLSIPGQTAEGGPVPEPNYGGQFNPSAIPGVTAEGTVAVTYVEQPGTYADGTAYSLRKPVYQFHDLGYGAMQANTMMSPRVGPQLPGMGLLEAVPDATILALADPDDANRDGISGRPNYVWNYTTKQKVLGRFGWKANQPDLHQQTASAFNGDIGITTSLFSNSDMTTTQQKLYGQLPNGGSPELEDKNLDNVVVYLQTLAVPARRNVQDETVLRGKQLFQQLNCMGCHVAKLQTGAHSVVVLSNQTIRPYTDLLLHDMGDGLADNRPDFEATGTEWRTPPLWGIGLIKLVNRHTYLLHDGRARSVEEAILWHAGEAKKAADGFRNLSKKDRDALVTFVQSL